MTKKEIDRFLSVWPNGNQLNCYAPNGFNAPVANKSLVLSTGEGTLEGIDPFGHRFLTDVIHLKFSPAPTPKNKSNKDNQ